MMGASTSSLLDGASIEAFCGLLSWDRRARPRGCDRFRERVRSLAAAGHLPASIPDPDPVLVIAARSRLMLGDEDARAELVGLLLSDDASARTAAIAALQEKYGDARGYDPVAGPDDRRQAVARWRE